jgi:metallo-beta-lactamase family protein
MAGEALKYYIARVSELDPDMRPTRKDVSTFATARFQTIASSQQSKELTASRRSAIVISSSGMATGGRVLHHMARALPDPKNTVLFVGYQAAGTRGRSLVDGAREVRIHGHLVAVNARIARNDSMSAHADRGEILRWLGTLPAAPGRLCLVHGEPAPMDALKQLIAQRLGWAAHTPAHQEKLAI